MEKLYKVKVGLSAHGWTSRVLAIDIIKETAKTFSLVGGKIVRKADIDEPKSILRRLHYVWMYTMWVKEKPEQAKSALIDQIKYDAETIKTEFEESYKHIENYHEIIRGV